MSDMPENGQQGFIIMLLILSVYALLLICWVFYIAVMGLRDRRHTLSGFAKINGYAVLAVGLVLDLFLAWVVGPILFLERPRNLTLTAVLKRHHRDHPASWRFRLSVWFCHKLLDPFDSRGKHC
jgi:hypothetical protein